MAYAKADAATTLQYPCERCPLRGNSAFRPFSEDELTFMTGFKRGELTAAAGTLIFEEGTEGAHLYTVLCGWGVRHKSLPDGRRQILNFLLPGDLVGLQASLLSAAQHGIESLTEVELCVFPRRRTYELFARMPALAYELAWLGSREESLIDENLTSVGQRNAQERIAALLISLYRRADALGLVSEDSFAFPLTQQHLADALGLSLVHTSKTWSRLRRAGLFALSGGRLKLLNPRLTERMALLFEGERRPRPLI